MAHKNNEQNLIPASERTPEERREIAKKAGIASGEARRKKRSTKQAAKYILDMQPELPQKTIDALIKTGIDPNERPDIRTLSILALAQKSMKGDLKATRMLLEIAGDIADARTQIEREKLKLERERFAFEREFYLGDQTASREDDGFLTALNDTAGEVNTDAGDVPDDLDPEE